MRMPPPAAEISDLECVPPPPPDLPLLEPRGDSIYTNFFRGAIRLLEGQRHTESAILQGTHRGAGGVGASGTDFQGSRLVRISLTFFPLRFSLTL